jgi:hypothetical protein
VQMHSGLEEVNKKRQGQNSLGKSVSSCWLCSCVVTIEAPSAFVMIRSRGTRADNLCSWFQTNVL